MASPPDRVGQQPAPAGQNYQLSLRARSRLTEPKDFEEIILASSTALKLTNPQSGLAFDIAGPDAHLRRR